MRTVVTSTPYPWPYDQVVADDRLALVVAGCDPHWCGSSLDTSVAATHLHDLAVAIAAGGGTVVALEHPPARRFRASHRVPRSIEGAEVLTVGGIDGSYGSGLDPLLRARGVRHVLVGGYGLEAPVHSTLRGLNDRGYECLLVADACAPLDRSCVAGAISSIEMSGGIFGAVARTHDVLAALQSDASPATERTDR
jgi:biuret amidohydrolase